MPSAACVVWSETDDYKNPLILVGIESKYVRDKQETVNIDEIRKKKQPSSFANLRLTPSKQSGQIRMEDFERVARSDFAGAAAAASGSAAHPTPSEYLIQAKIIFAKRAVALEELYRTRVQFDTPSFDAGAGIYSVNYRWTAVATHFGITKGQIEGSETPRQAIMREIAEETGVKLNTSVGASELIEMDSQGDCTFFSLKLTGKDVEMWKKTIAGRLEKRHGELFDLAFVPKIRLDSHFSGIIDGIKMNQKTKIGLKLFLGSPDSPGRSVSSAHGGPASHGHARSGKGGRGRSKRLRSKKRGLKQKKRAQKSKKRGHV